MRFIRELDLETMCLNAIVDNIDKFLKKEYEPDEVVGAPLEFLRRLYSDRLCSIIRKDHCIPNSYMDFFLTPYWKEVRIFGFNLSHSRIINKLRVIGTTITSLNLKNSATSADMLTAIICCVPNVVYLSLECTECNDSVLAFIGKTCNSLVTLNLQECVNVTDIGIMNLCNVDRKEVGFNSLRALNIDDTSVTDDCIPIILKYLKSLEYLHYEYFPTIFHKLHQTGTDLSDTKYKFKSFEHQYSQYVTLEDILKTWASLCPEIARVYIEDDVDERHLEICAKFQHLRILKILNNDIAIIKGPGADFFKIRGPQLTEMHLKCATVSVPVIIECCRSLQNLTFESVSFDDFDERSELQGLHDLTFLSLIFIDLTMPLTFKSIQFLINSSINLTELGITYAEHFTEEVANFILKSPNLTAVDVSFTDIKQDTLLLFFLSEKIMKICVDGCPHSSVPIDYETFKFVSHNPYGCTVSWKVDFHSNALETYWRHYEPKWAGDITI